MIEKHNSLMRIFYFIRTRRWSNAQYSTGFYFRHFRLKTAVIVLGELKGVIILRLIINGC